MRLLLDECVDWRLVRDLAPHDTRTARQMGWTSVKNGELLALAERDFDAFITVDRNLTSQQTIAGLHLAIVVLRAQSNRLAHLQALVPELLRRLDQGVKPGLVYLIPA